MTFAGAGAGAGARWSPSGEPQMGGPVRRGRTAPGAGSPEPSERAAAACRQGCRRADYKESGVAEEPTTADNSA